MIELEPISKSTTSLEDAGIRVIEGYIPSPIDVEYRERMVKESLAGPRPPKPITPTHFNGKLIDELNGQEKEDFYLSMQPQTTQSALIAQKSRNPDEDKEWANRPIPLEAQLRDEDGNIIFNERPLDPQETILYEERRRKSKNTQGQSEKSSVEPETRRKGIEAFTYSKPAELTPEEIKKVTKLTPIESQPLEPVTVKKKGFWASIFGSKKESADLKIERMKMTVKGKHLVFTKEDDADRD